VGPELDFDTVFEGDTRTVQKKPREDTITAKQTSGGAVVNSNKDDSKDNTNISNENNNKDKENEREKSLEAIERQITITGTNSSSKQIGIGFRSSVQSKGGFGRNTGIAFGTSLPVQIPMAKMVGKNTKEAVKNNKETNDSNEEIQIKKEVEKEDSKVDGDIFAYDDDKAGGRENDNDKKESKKGKEKIVDGEEEDIKLGGFQKVENSKNEEEIKKMEVTAITEDVKIEKPVKEDEENVVGIPISNKGDKNTNISEEKEETKDESDEDDNDNENEDRKVFIAPHEYAQSLKTQNEIDDEIWDVPVSGSFRRRNTDLWN